MVELRRDEGYQAEYGQLRLRVTQENDSLSVVVHDTTKGPLDGRVFDGRASTVEEAKELAISRANECIGTPVAPPEWVFFGAPTPIIW